ncbi:MAG: hypothetical protein PSY14_06895 [bacterium]|nr:hypothetical protein [bacterium]
MLNRMNMLTIEIKNSPSDAPDYAQGTRGGEGFKGAKILKAIVVRKGTEEGNDTVDLQFEDDSGQKFVAMTTGKLLQQLAGTLNVKPGTIN